VKTKYQVHEVTWWDSCSAAGWQSKEEVGDFNAKPMECRTVGVLVAEDKNHITMALSVCPESRKEFADVIQIPKVAIQSRRKIRSYK